MATSAVAVIEPRDYQIEAVAKVQEAEARGVRRQLGQAACGLGKTVIAALLAKERGKRTLFIAHRDELIRQARERFAQVWPQADIGVVKAGQNEVDRQVVIASVQTIARDTRMQRLLDPIHNNGLLSSVDPFDLLIADEAHHCKATTWRNALMR